MDKYLLKFYVLDTVLKTEDNLTKKTAWHCLRGTPSLSEDSQ